MTLGLHHIFFDPDGFKYIVKLARIVQPKKEKEKKGAKERKDSVIDLTVVPKPSRIMIERYTLIVRPSHPPPRPLHLPTTH
jgi:hypothetical protein